MSKRLCLSIIRQRYNTFGDGRITQYMHQNACICIVVLNKSGKIPMRNYIKSRRGGGEGYCKLLFSLYLQLLSPLWDIPLGYYSLKCCIKIEKLLFCSSGKFVEPCILDFFGCLYLAESSFQGTRMSFTSFIRTII